MSPGRACHQPFSDDLPSGRCAVERAGLPYSRSPHGFEGIPLARIELRVMITPSLKVATCAYFLKDTSMPVEPEFGHVRERAFRVGLPLVPRQRLEHLTAAKVFDGCPQHLDVLLSSSSMSAPARSALRNAYIVLDGNSSSPP